MYNNFEAANPGNISTPKPSSAASDVYKRQGKQVIKKFELNKNKSPQQYGIGFKEIWEIDNNHHKEGLVMHTTCLLYTSPSPRDRTRSRMPSSA